MLTLFFGGKVFLKNDFEETDLLVCGEKIAKIAKIDQKKLVHLPVEVTTIDCSSKLLLPGFIDPHCHISGGSGEGGGFFSQSMPILAEEFIFGGVTTAVGTLGVDTTTKTMPDLIAKVKAHNDIGLSAFCYTGGYDIPPQTITGSVRNDLLFVNEIIGVGEIAIADRRAPEPSLDNLARASVDAYVGGMLTGKAGVTHFHVGEADRKLLTVRNLLEAHTINAAKLYLTHIERSKALVEEAVALAHRGAFIDFDIHERDSHQWFKVFKDLGGPLSQLTISSDGGISSPRELWQEFRNNALIHKIKLPQLISLFSSNAAKALSFDQKGSFAHGADADILVADAKDLNLNHVMAKGRFLLRDAVISVPNRAAHNRRGFDIYEIH